MKKTIVLCLASLSLLFSCNPAKKLTKAYNKVAADIPANTTNKAKLVGWINAHFPIQEKTIIKDSIVHDFIESYKYDTVTVQKDNEVIKYITKTDTVIVNKVTTKTVTGKDTTSNFMQHLELQRLIKENNAKDAQISIINAKLTNSIEDRDKAENRANKMAWLLLLVFVCALASHWLRSKLF